MKQTNMSFSFTHGAAKKFDEAGDVVPLSDFSKSCVIPLTFDVGLRFYNASV